MIFFGLAVVAILGGAYLFLFKRADTVRAAKGYKDADTPQVAADMFKKAIEKCEYDIAAHYCTAGSAEQFRRGGDAAAKFGTAIDNLSYQMKERGLLRDEVKFVLYGMDPFPKDILITVGKENGDTAEAVIVFSMPYISNQPISGSWNIKQEILQVYCRSMKYANATTAVVPMKKEGGQWKFDFPADASLQARIGYMNDKYKNYTNPMEIVTMEVKNDPSTKEDATRRLNRCWSPGRRSSISGAFHSTRRPPHVPVPFAARCERRAVRGALQPVWSRHSQEKKAAGRRSRRRPTSSRTPRRTWSMPCLYRPSTTRRRSSR